MGKFLFEKYSKAPVLTWLFIHSRYRRMVVNRVSRLNILSPEIHRVQKARQIVEINVDSLCQASL
jgi:hypothetical protein